MTTKKPLFMTLVISILFISQIAYAKDRLLVVINHSSGIGRAEAVYYNQVEHQLYNDFDLEVVAPRQKLEDIPGLGDYYGIVAVGGDGTVHRIFNALAKKNLLDIPVAHIPAGSGNALAKSIFHNHQRPNETYGVSAMVQRIKEKFHRPIDLWHYKTDAGAAGISFLGFAFGIIADIDEESTRLRNTCLSRWRFEIFGGLLSACWLRNYRGGLVEVTKPTKPARLIWGMNIPFGTETMKIAPEARLDDGFLHVMTVKSDQNWLQEKLNTVRFLLSLEQEPYNLPFVSVEKHSHIVLNIEKNQHVTIDGEPLSLETTRLEIVHAEKYGRVFSF